MGPTATTRPRPPCTLPRRSTPSTRRASPPALSRPVLRPPLATLARAPTKTQVAPPPCSRSSTSRSRVGRRSPTQCAPPPRSPTSTPRSPLLRTRRRLGTPLWLTWRQLLRTQNPLLPAKIQPQLTLRPCRPNL